MPNVEPVIDPHHHLWDLRHNRYPWLQTRPLKPRLEGDIRPIAKDYLLENYLADTSNQNVAKSVHVECGWDPSNPVGETEWLQRLAEEVASVFLFLARSRGLRQPRPELSEALGTEIKPNPAPKARMVSHLA
jgi:predicted TIM-barrel fold metal-dependent hydrolase